MWSRRAIAVVMLAVLGASMSGVALEFHHPERCSDSHGQAGDCRTCYLISLGRTAVVDTPIISVVGDDITCVAEPIVGEDPLVADHHPSAAPRAPPVV